MTTNKVSITSNEDKTTIKINGEEVKNVTKYALSQHANEDFALFSMEVVVDEVDIDAEAEVSKQEI